MNCRRSGDDEQEARRLRDTLPGNDDSWGTLSDSDRHQMPTNVCNWFQPTRAV
jgi:hypothetical protein